MRSVIREEAPGDAASIHRLNATAFETDAEAKLVDTLRAAGALILSLVAEQDGEIVGHIAFSPVVVDSGQRTSQGVGLAPMAVAPAHQRQGIGGRLIDDGLRRLATRVTVSAWCSDMPSTTRVTDSHEPATSACDGSAPCRTTSSSHAS
jgi:predicted N-acetyltransferase YhbS